MLSSLPTDYYVQVPLCHGCALRGNTDYFGSDLIKGGIRDVGVQGCCDACASQDGCAVWTYSAASSTCWIKTQDALELEMPLRTADRISGLNCMNLCDTQCRARFRLWLIITAGVALALGICMAVSLFHDARLLARRRSLPPASLDDELWLTPYRLDVVFEPSTWECAANTLMCGGLLAWFVYGTWLGFACPTCAVCPSAIGLRAYLVSTWLGGLLLWIGLLVLAWRDPPNSNTSTGMRKAMSRLEFPNNSDVYAQHVRTSGYHRVLHGW